MYGHASASIRQVSAAGSANTAAPVSSATAVVACVSRALGDERVPERVQRRGGQDQRKRDERQGARPPATPRGLTPRAPRTSRR